MARRKRNTSAGGPPGLKLLINASEPDESRIAVLRAGKLEEYYLERQSLGSTLGNVYKARITNVEKSIGAAFVEFGQGRQGFLHVSDLCMAAVGDEAAELLSGVQAAREVAHDEDVVEPAAKVKSADAESDGEAGDEAEAEADASESSSGRRGGRRRSGGRRSRGAVADDAATAVAADPQDEDASAQAADSAESPDGDGDDESDETLEVLDLEEIDESEDGDDADEDDEVYSPDAVIDPQEAVDSERGAHVVELRFAGEDEDEDDGDLDDDTPVEELADIHDEEPDEDEEDDDELPPIHGPVPLSAEEVAALRVVADDDDDDDDGEEDDDEADDDEHEVVVGLRRDASEDDDDADEDAEDGAAESESNEPKAADDEADEDGAPRRRRRRRRRGGAGRKRNDSESEAGEASEASTNDGDDDGEAADSDDDNESDGEDGGRTRRRRGRRGGRRRRGSKAEGESDGEAESAKESKSDGQGKASRNGSDAGRRGKRGGGNKRGGNGGGGRSGGRGSRKMPPIEDILKKGQEIVVQVIKDGIGTKGPTLTTFLSVPGRFIVLMPGIHKRGVSRKVTDGKERDRLKAIVRDLEVPDGVGFIVRTAGAGASREDLERDLAYLLRLWDQMQSRVKQYSAPVLLYQENDLVIRTLRDLYDGTGEIVIDDKPTADKAKEFMAQIMPECVEKVSAYDDQKPLFSHYGIETEIGRLLESRIELKSGASLVLEQTEALVAIDVNSGRFKPDEPGIDNTAFKVNSEAAVEIARQLRLRDLGGVVVIDFIDMRTEKHRKAIERLFKDELRRDRARIKVARFSPFGIMELTRQRVRPSLKRTVHKACPYCTNTGFIPSDETSCLNVIRKVRDNLWRPGSVLVVTVRPEVAEAVLNTQKKVLADLEEQGQRQIFIRADHRLAYEDIEVRAMVALPDEIDHRRA